MRMKIIVIAVAASLVTWAPPALARQDVELPYIFGVAPDDSVWQATGIDTTVGALLTINSDINIFPSVNRKPSADYSGRQYTGLVAVDKLFMLTKRSLHLWLRYRHHELA